MILDGFLNFSGSVVAGNLVPQSLVGTGNILSTNAINTGVQPVDIGQGQDLTVFFNMVAALVGATSLECQLLSSDDAASTVNTQVIGSTGAIPVASLIAGRSFGLSVDRAAPYVARRYVAVRYVVTGTSTAGSVLANVVLDFQGAQNTQYRSGFAVL